MSVSKLMLSFDFQDLFHLNGGPLVVGSSSLEPNSFENNTIGGAEYSYFSLFFLELVYMFMRMQLI